MTGYKRLTATSPGNQHERQKKRPAANRSQPNRRYQKCHSTTFIIHHLGKWWEAGPPMAAPSRPTVRHINKDNIPLDVRQWPQWVLWCYEERDGKQTKVPYQALANAKQRASVTNPSTWTSFEQALMALGSGRYDGVGYVLTEDDPLIGVDLDHCIKDGKLEGWASDIVKALNSYSEITPSKEGVRIFARGELPPGVRGRKKGDIEMYSSGRFLTVTGHHIKDVSSAIESRTSEALKLFVDVFGDVHPTVESVRANTPSSLSDTDVLTLAQAARNGTKFRALWAGSTEGYQSRSEAEAALCSLLAFYTQDRAQLERLMSDSQCERWKTSKPDYRERTMNLALRGMSETYKPSTRRDDYYSASPKREVPAERIMPGAEQTEPNDYFLSAEAPVVPAERIEDRGDVFRTARQIAEQTPDKPDWIALPWLVRGGISELDGKIKGGKSTWALALCRAVLDGRDFMGWPTTRGAVVYLTEQPASSLREALRRADLLERDDFHVLLWSDVTQLSWPQKMGIATQKAHEVGAVAIIVDTLGWWAGLKGDEENSAGSAQTAMEPIAEAIKGDPKFGVFILRHERKGGGEVGESGRGSSAFGGSVDIVLSIRRPEGNPGASPNMRVIHSLSRFDETPSELMIELAHDGQYIAHGDVYAVALTTAKNAAIEALKAGKLNQDGQFTHTLTLDEIMAYCADRGVKRSTLQPALEKMATEFLVRKTGAGKKGSPFAYEWMGD